MSTAAATADAMHAPVKGKKKLILIVGAAVLVLALAAVAALLVLKRPAQEDAEAADDEPVAEEGVAHDPKHPPTYVALEAFTVNLADKETDRYAQVAITLEMRDAATGDAIKAFMPAVRNNILMVLAHKTASELLERDGKTRLADEVRRETARALGVNVPADDGEDDGTAGTRKKKKKKPAPELPVSAVYFSTFIIQ